MRVAVSFPDDLRGLIPAQRTGDGPDSTRTGRTPDGSPTVDGRGWVRVFGADFDMGAWFDPGMLPHEPERTDREAP